MISGAAKNTPQTAIPELPPSGCPNTHPLPSPPCPDSSRRALARFRSAQLREADRRFLDIAAKHPGLSDAEIEDLATPSDWIAARAWLQRSRLRRAHGQATSYSSLLVPAWLGRLPVPWRLPVLRKLQALGQAKSRLMRNWTMTWSILRRVGLSALAVGRRSAQGKRP